MVPTAMATSPHNSSLAAGLVSSPHAPAATAKVWILQPDIHHYRTPVFDGVRAKGLADGRYTLEVLGGMKDGKAIGGEGRAYYRHVPRSVLTKFGVTYFRWEAAPGLVESERPDVLVVEANIRNLTCWKLLAKCRRMGVPVVGWSKIHSYSKAAGVAGGVMGILKRRFYGKFDRMICYGESSKAELVGLGYPTDRAIIANNTIDTRKIFAEGDALRTRGMKIREERGLVGKKILLCIGRMDADKRHQDLLDAWPRLVALDPNLVLVLISGGPMLEEIRAKAAAVDAARIVVTGRVPEGDDYAWIATSDVCIYPGAVGLAINQSLAFGKPTLIANEIGADSEILVGDENPGAQTGWRYERGNLAAMVEGVRKILGGGGDVDSVCRRAMELMRDKVTLDHMISAIDRSIRLALDLRR
jgi:glycosyltransferase involved in cell wall biosynthesis